MPARPRVFAVLAALAALAVLAGCADVNAGTAAVERLESRFADEPDVVEVIGRGSNDLPWTGRADGVLVVDESASPARVRELAHELGEWVSDDATGVTGWDAVRVRYGGFEFGVGETAAGTDGAVDAMEALIGAGAVGDRLAGSDDDDAPDGAAGLVVEFDVAAGADDDLAGLFALVGDLADDLDPARSEPGISIVHRDAGLTTTLAADAGVDLGDELAVVSAARPGVGLLEASVRPGAVALHVDAFADVAVALALVGSAADGVAVHVDGGGVRWDEDVDPATIAAAVGVRPLPGIGGITLVGDRVEVLLDDAAEFAPIAARLQEALPIGGGTVRLGTAGDDYSVRSEHAELTAGATILDALRAAGASGAVLDPDRLRVEADRSEFDAVVRAAASSVPAGTSLRLDEAGSGAGIWFEAAPALDEEAILADLREIDEPTAAERDLVSRLVRAWNAD